MLTDPSVYTFDMEQDPDDLARQAQEVACIIFPELKGTFRAHRIFKWRDKLPTFRPGYLDALKRFWENPQEGPVYFCGRLFRRAQHRRRVIYRHGMRAEGACGALKTGGFHQK